MTGNSDSSNYNWKLYTSKDGKSYTCDYSGKDHWSTNTPTLEACKNYYNTRYPSGTHSVDYGTLSFYKTNDPSKNNCYVSNNKPCKLTESTPNSSLTDGTQLFLPKTVTLCGMNTNCAIPAFPPESTESNSGGSGKIILILVISVISIFLFIILFYLYKKYKTI
jgi:hypothetical protein